MDKFNKLLNISPGALTQLNAGLNKVEQKFEKSFEASLTRERTDQAFTVSGFFGKGGTVETQGAALGTNMGQQLGFDDSTTKSLATATSWLGKFAFGLTGLVAPLFTTDKRLEAVGKAFDKASKQITPEFLEKIDKSFATTITSMVNNLDNLDSGAIETLAASAPEISIDPTVQAFNTREAMLALADGMKEAEESMGGAEGAGRKFVAQLNELIEQKVKFNLTKAVLDEAELLGDEGGAELKDAFIKLTK